MTARPFWLISLLLLAVTFTASCGTGRETVQLARASQPDATTHDAALTHDPTPAAAQEDGSAAAQPAPPGIEVVGTGLPKPDTAGTAALVLRTRRPTDGFDLDPPEGFSAVDYHPDHGKSMVLEGRLGGVRFYYRRGTGQSVVVAAWSPAPSRDQGWLERHRTHGGTVQHGRAVHGAASVWELGDEPAGGAVKRTSLAVTLTDGTLVWLSGTDIEDASFLYDFLTRIEDAPGSLEPRPEPGQAVPGGTTD